MIDVTGLVIHIIVTLSYHTKKDIKGSGTIML